ncbi:MULTISPECIES: YebO family protein [Rahnella]|jgi:flagellar biosynthesis/type III secretory pathway M-ring protein FliF/YscJ|uniref:YebO family protein n=1 Tax=Rahnella TaxID=34037 RepID=UPI00104CD5C6|nr:MULTISPECIES: YebO family protein [Rahnella]TCQ93174.1 YebO-like protein [Rahnella sp. JUb53]
MFDFAMGQNSLASLVLFALSALLFLLVWFFVSRASVRANEQIALLHEIAEQQRQQTELLKVLAAHARGKAPPVEAEDDSALSLRGFIPER